MKKYLSLQSKPIIVQLLLILLVVCVVIASGFIVSLYEYQVLLFIIGLIIFVMMLRDPFLGIILFVFLIPAEVLLVMEGGSTILRYLGIIIFITWVLRLLVDRRKVYFHQTQIFFVLYVVWAGLSYLWSNSPDRVLGLIFTYIQLLGIFLIIVDQVNSPKRLRLIIGAIIAGGVLAVILGYSVGEFFPERYGGERLVLTQNQGGSTEYGYPLAFSMVALGITAVMSKGKLRIIAYLFFLLGIYVLILIGLRGAIFAVPLSIVYGLSFIKDIGYKKWLGLSLGSLVFIVMWYLIQNQLLPEGLSKHLLFSNLFQSGGSGRTLIWNAAMDLIRKKPFLGVGLNQFVTESASLSMLDFRGKGVHSDYIGSLVELGLPGFFLFVIGLYRCFQSLLAARKNATGEINEMIISIILSVFISIIIGMIFIQLLQWKYLWVIFALALASSRQEIWRKEV